MSNYRATIFAIGLLAAIARFANAQSATASLTGTVTDPQGASVSGAHVTLTDAAKNLVRQTATNREGQFIFAQISPSSYSVRVEHPGFTAAETPNLILHVNDLSSIRVQLPVGAREDKIVVRDDAPQVSESPAVVTFINRAFIENQPLNGRSFQTLDDYSVES